MQTEMYLPSTSQHIYRRLFVGGFNQFAQGEKETMRLEATEGARQGMPKGFAPRSPSKRSKKQNCDDWKVIAKDART